MPVCFPPNSISLEYLDVGSFNMNIDGFVHSKICPYTILAQATLGYYELYCGETEYAQLKQGEAFLTGAHRSLKIIHHTNADRGGRMKARWIHIHFSLFGTIDLLSLFQLPLRVMKPQCRPFAEIICALSDEAHCLSNPFALSARKQELAFRFLQRICDIAPIRPSAKDLLESDSWLLPVISYMKENISRKITIDQLARMANLSAPHFHARFRDCIGQSPIQHLKQLRLASASKLLINLENQPLKRIAEETGFCNEFHLSREFRRMFGKSPVEWRRDYNRSLP